MTTTRFTISGAQKPLAVPIHSSSAASPDEECSCPQAAAHGVPTVATKNGGPVDIMATLHHGILVDPTSSTDVADGLVK